MLSKKSREAGDGNLFGSGRLPSFRLGPAGAPSVDSSGPEARRKDPTAPLPHPYPLPSPLVCPTSPPSLRFPHIMLMIPATSAFQGSRRTPETHLTSKLHFLDSGVLMKVLNLVL